MYQTNAFIYSDELALPLDLNKLVAPYSEAYFYFNDTGHVCFLTDTMKLGF